jgi:REP element-mobilizing transposase RayT
MHHIICKGIDRVKIFQDDTDRDSFLHRLGNILTETLTPCYAWALIPNHFHLLLRTGNVSIETVMRRLLTGYAVTYNRRHRRHGYLFQNRYKSILCQEDPYLLELVRYIHLNPLRAKILTTLGELDHYVYCGHSVLMGKRENDWQELDAVLSLFGNRVSAARKRYRTFVEEGVAQGKRPELTGGGLIRSAGGWKGFKSLHKVRPHLKGDERILGDSDFVHSVLEAANEKIERRYVLRSQGYDFDKLVERVADLFGMEAKELLVPGKQPRRVEARSLLCYWAVKELGIRGTWVAEKLGITQPGVSKAVRRGEQLASKEHLSIFSDRKL